MATSTATAGLGTLLQRSTDGVTYSTIAEVREISLSGEPADQIDVTHQESPNTTREYIQGFKNPGSISFNMNYLPSTAAQTVVTDDYNARTTNYWQIVLTDTMSTKIKFQAYVESVSVSAPIDDRLSADVSLKIAGAIDWSG